jgi:hypothetical protein
VKQPAAFFAFAAYCLPAEELGGGQDDIVKEAYLRLSPHDRMALRAYVHHLLAGGYSDEELWRIWNASGAGIAFFPTPRGFLTETVAMMASSA